MCFLSAKEWPLTRKASTWLNFGQVYSWCYIPDFHFLIYFRKCVLSQLLWDVKILNNLLPVLPPKSDFLKDVRMISFKCNCPERPDSYLYVSGGRYRPNFSWPLAPSCKTISCPEGTRKFSFPLSKVILQRQIAYSPTPAIKNSLAFFLIQVEYKDLVCGLYPIADNGIEIISISLCSSCLEWFFLNTPLFYTCSQNQHSECSV